MGSGATLLSSEMCRPILSSSLAVTTSQFSVLIGQKMELTGWDDGNDISKLSCPVHSLCCFYVFLVVVFPGY